MNNFIEIKNKLINLNMVRDVTFTLRTNDISTVIFNFNNDDSFTYKFPEPERYKVKEIKELILGNDNIRIKE